MRERLYDPSIASDVRVIDLWAARSNVLFTRAIRSYLSAEERARADRYPDGRRADRFVAGRAGLRKLLALYVDGDPGNLYLVQGPGGKPRLDASRHGADVSFSVSYSGDIIVYAISRQGPVGVDVERKRAALVQEPLNRVAFTPSEIRFLQSSALEDRCETFFVWWTRKEAVAKATGRGVPILRSIKMPISEPLASRPQLCGGWWVQDLLIAPRYAAALATRRPAKVGPVRWLTAEETPQVSSARDQGPRRAAR